MSSGLLFRLQMVPPIGLRVMRETWGLFYILLIQNPCTMITRRIEESGSRHQLLCQTYRGTSSPLLRCNLVLKGPRGTPSCNSASSHTLPREIARNAPALQFLSGLILREDHIEQSRPSTVCCSDQIPTTRHYTHGILKI